jgi:hypothetical protein
VPPFLHPRSVTPAIGNLESGGLERPYLEPNHWKLIDVGPRRSQSMVIERFRRLFRRGSTEPANIAALGEESSRITAALIHLAAHGNLDQYPVSRNTKQALVETAGRRRLVEWRRSHSRFELTRAGQRLAAASSIGRPISDGYR